MIPNQGILRHLLLLENKIKFHVAIKKLTLMEMTKN